MKNKSSNSSCCKEVKIKGQAKLNTNVKKGLTPSKAKRRGKA